MLDLKLRCELLALMLCACPAEGDEDDGGVGSETTSEEMTSDAMTEPDPDPTTSSADPSEPACVEPVPDVYADWSVSLDDWPVDDEDNFVIDATCRLGAIDYAEGIEFELHCDDAGTSRYVVIEGTGSDAGWEEWPRGIDVSLHYRYYRDWELSGRSVERVAVREADGGALLFAAADTGQVDPGELNPFGPDVAPLELAEEVLDCEGQVGDEVALQLHFSLGDETVALQAGQEGVLPIPDSTEIYAINLESADGLGPDYVGDAIPGHIRFVLIRVIDAR